jgi:hypothetical protein
MCRNIKTLHNFRPPATHEEIHASSLQFVRKLSGFTRPSKANEAVFNRAVEDVARSRARAARRAPDDGPAPGSGGRSAESPEPCREALRPPRPRGGQP